MPESARLNPTDPTLWGLTPMELHDAFWASHGVVCVRRHCCVAPSQSADLFLLLEPTQFAVFDLRAIAESLLWSHADITRVQLVPEKEDSYVERVVRTTSGDVLRIERRYRSDAAGTGVVHLARRVNHARDWAMAETTSDAFANMRRQRRTRIDAAQCHGAVLESGGARVGVAQRAMSLIVASWPHPDRVIEAITTDAEGIFGVDDSVAHDGDRIVGPLWIGARASAHDTHAAPHIAVEAIGPAAVWDAVPTEPHRVRPISEIFATDSVARVAVTHAERSFYAPIKRLLDIIISLSVLVLTAPLMLVCATLIVIDDGFPVLFGHRRQSRGGSSFRCWKFRTMRRDAEARVADLRKQNLCDGPQVLIKDDPRVTKIGKTLRKFQLDEFPQFWNVLIGDMSLVGPRPSPDNENQYCPAWREIRLSVRPGITGLWQVMRTREAGKDFQEWIQYDIEYVRRMGPWLDLRICLQTVRNILVRRHTGA